MADGGGRGRARLDRFLAARDAKLAGEAQPGASALADTTPPAAAPVAPAEGAAPAAAPPLTDTLNAANRQAMADAIRAEREAYETKQRLKSLEEENKRIKAESEALSKLTPLELLEKRGTTFQGIAEEIVAGKHKPRTAEQLALEAADARAKALEDRLAAIEGEREKTTKEAAFKGVADALTSDLKANHATTYPVLATYADAGERVQRLKEQNPDVGYPEIAAHLEKELRSFQSVDSLKARVAADPEYKALVLSALGIQSNPPAQQVPQGKPRIGNPPDAISATRAADTGMRSTPQISGRDARKSAALGAANRRAAQG